MKVKELIEKLKEFDSDLDVFIEDSEMGYALDVSLEIAYKTSGDYISYQGTEEQKCVILR